MQQQGPASQALAGLMGNQAAQAQLLLQIARQQTAEYQMQTTLAKQLAVQLAGQGVKVKGSGGLQVTRAGGYIPNATKMAEVVGAQAGGYTPGRVVSSPVGGVMNTAEDVKYIPGFAQPTVIGLTDGVSTLYDQEKGVNDDTSAITAFITSGDVDIVDGDNSMFIKRYIPDFKDQSGGLNMQFLVRQYPGATQTVASSTVVFSTTTKVDMRARGRQVAIKIISTDVDTKW